MCMNKRQIIAIGLLCLAATAADAQLSIGVRGGWTQTSISQSNTGRVDETFSKLSGYETGIQAGYSITDWMSVRADLNFMQRSYRKDRNLHYLDPVFTEYHNSYLIMPVMADFSFGGERLHGHLLGGGFASYWLNAEIHGKTYWLTDYYVFFEDFDEYRDFNSEDQRFTAGFVGGTGLSYSINSNLSFNSDILYYYDLVSHHKGYDHLSDPRYLNTLSISLGISYKF